ncbi:MAG TPA: formylglycine-generating enzyme family protein [Accumulibacter sp.]|nr:formylglycine-generating enzyme family protein [Accumulibacter sp.]
MPGDRARVEAWQAFTRRLAEHGALPVAWLPMSPALVPAEALRYTELHCLDGAHGLRALRARKAGTAAAAPVSPPTVPAAAPAADSPTGAVSRHALLPALLTRLACCVRVEPGLLRALRRLDADAAAEPGLEAIVWSYAPVVAAGSRFCEITPAYVAAYRDRFFALAAAEQQEILRRILDAHAWRGRSTESAELLIWQAHARQEAVSDEFVARIDEARDWFARFGAGGRSVLGDAAGYAGDLFHRHGDDRAWIAANSPLLAPIWALAGVDDIPAGLQPADVAAARQRGAAVASTWRLQQQNDRFVLLPDRGEAGRWPTLTLEGGVVCGLRTDAGWRQRWLEPCAAPLTLPLAHAAKLSEIALDSGRRHYRLLRLQRPPWAKELARDGHGLYLDVDCNGVVQRFRWIDPGEFMMGSPPDEPERREDEVQHPVTLSRGFWLADTACTQAFWQAVTGKNPSHFQGDPGNPVESVSWDEVQTFIGKLRRRLPGLPARLPTEAEWEYACRAGTTTPFSFGDQITPDRVNYNGNYPYAGGKIGRYRGQTVPVASLPANAWGLYEMHGNVWEWCADRFGAYPTGPQVDPQGPRTGGARVLRGGSWSFYGRVVRSACRRRFGPDRHDGVIGFRLALGPGEQVLSPAEPVTRKGLAAEPTTRRSRTTESSSTAPLA